MWLYHNPWESGQNQDCEQGGAKQAKPSDEFWILSYGQWKVLQNFIQELQSPGLITALYQLCCPLREIKSRAAIIDTERVLTFKHCGAIITDNT